MIENDILRLQVTVNVAESSELFEPCDYLKKYFIELSVIPVLLEVHPHINFVPPVIKENCI